MKSSEINTLLVALQSKDLKTKKLSTENHFNLVCLKKKLTDASQQASSVIEDLVDEYNATIINGQYICLNDDKTEDAERQAEFLKKWREAQKKEFTVPGLNFIKKKELYAFVLESDFNTSSVVTEYLLAPDEEEEKP